MEFSFLMLYTFSRPAFPRKLAVKQIWYPIAVPRTGWHQSCLRVQDMDGKQISGRLNGQAIFYPLTFLRSLLVGRKGRRRLKNKQYVIFHIGACIHIICLFFVSKVILHRNRADLNRAIYKKKIVLPRTTVYKKVTCGLKLFLMSSKA